MTEEERVKYYLGELYFKTNSDKLNDTTQMTVETMTPENMTPPILKDYFNKYNSSKLYRIGDLYNIPNITSYSIEDILTKKKLPEMLYKVYFNDYIRPLKETLIKYKKEKQPFLCDCCDIFYLINKYAFVKNRFSEDEKKTVILRCLNFKRHWFNYYNRPTDIPFEQKLNKLYWRGTTTGNEFKPANRFSLVTKYIDKHPDIDVGFSSVCQGNDKYKRYVKTKDDINILLKYKYILSLEGNDKDSGINWKLNSNSLVFMPRPRCFSWLMEDKLIPGFHYILINDDFSDLLEKLHWCNNNQEKCKEIVRNANKYMAQFANQTTEEAIEKRVIDLYFDKLAI